MRPISTLLAVSLLAGLGATAAVAMPHLDGTTAGNIAPPAAETVRLVCNYNRCRRVGGYYRPVYRAYRPYGYYRPYYGPHVGIGIGGVGLGIY